MEPLIETLGLKKYYSVADGKLYALDGIDISIKKGRTLGIVGESGCGKSTLGKVILRLIEPTAGQIFFEGENLMNYGPNQLREVRKEIQIIFQDPYSSVNPRMTVSELIGEPMIVFKMMKNRSMLQKHVGNLMDTVGLSKRLINSYPHELDGGRRQRIGIARALALEPKFIVCDEPVSALDVSIQAQILNLLMDLQEERDLTYMFITHDLSVVKHISDEIVVMYLGQCMERTSTKELFRNPLHPYTNTLLEAILEPNLDKKIKKEMIVKGEVMSPINPIPGCRFAHRCKYKKDECIGSDIDLIEYSENHFVACTLYE